MKNLFEQANKQEIISRINRLSSNSKPQWGKMDIAQMLAHCQRPMELALTNPKPPRQLIGRIFGPMSKAGVIGSVPFKRNGYTPKEFKISTPQDFDVQYDKLLDLINRFTAANISDKMHPFFGKLEEAEWGQSQYKHLDYHLAQFGV